LLDRSLDLVLVFTVLGCSHSMHYLFNCASNTVCLKLRIKQQLLS